MCQEFQLQEVIATYRKMADCSIWSRKNNFPSIKCSSANK